MVDAPEPQLQAAPGRPWLKVAIAAVFVGGVVAFFALGGQRYLSLDAVKANCGTEAACVVADAGFRSESVFAALAVGSLAAPVGEGVATAMPVLATRDPAGAAILRKLISRPLSPNEPAGAFATGALVRRLLPDWKIPDGPLGPRREAPPEEYDTPPTPVYRATASYPEAAGGIGGIVQVRVKIDAQGAVSEAKVIGDAANPALEWAALDAAKRWRFKPASRNGRAVPSEVTIPFRFSTSP